MAAVQLTLMIQLVPEVFYWIQAWTLGRPVQSVNPIIIILIHFEPRMACGVVISNNDRTRRFATAEPVFTPLRSNFKCLAPAQWKCLVGFCNQRFIGGSTIKETKQMCFFVDGNYRSNSLGVWTKLLECGPPPSGIFLFHNVSLEPKQSPLPPLVTWIHEVFSIPVHVHQLDSIGNYTRQTRQRVFGHQQSNVGVDGLRRGIKLCVVQSTRVHEWVFGSDSPYG
ncbi:uncharacterized protein TNCV_2288291 [Trichonephila clavipes]|nr:uncharacterized protein TNCV_2288291 [Trichonephila clavipes]